MNGRDVRRGGQAEARREPFPARHLRRFIGIERDQDYFDIMVERIVEAHRQPRLELPDPPRQPEQQGFDL